MRKRRVCITGIGLVSPLGNTREETWTKVLAGQSGAAPITQFSASTWPTTFACEVKGNALSDNLLDPHIRKYLNRPSGFGVAAAAEAVNDSGIVGQVETTRFGLAVGANIGALSPIELLRIISSNSTEKLSLESNSSHAIIRNHPGTLAAVISSKWHCNGPAATIHTACASSGQSLGMAYRMIARGECDAMIAGGADSLSAELLLAGFCLIGALSRRNDEPTMASRPFDSSRDGFVAGEGAAMLVFEELEHAKARGAEIYAEVCGYGETESAYRITDLPPDGRGIVEAMKFALDEADLSPTDINYVNAHGTSTELNDRIEALAIRRVFTEYGSNPLVSSTKSETGHLISAAGALELAFCALTIRDQRVPPNRNLEHSDCGDDLDFVRTSARQTRVCAAMSNSIGFGGSNSSLLVAEVR